MTGEWPLTSFDWVWIAGAVLGVPAMLAFGWYLDRTPPVRPWYTRRMSLLTILIIVLIVCLIVGLLGRGRYY